MPEWLITTTLVFLLLWNIRLHFRLSRVEKYAALHAECFIQHQENMLELISNLDPYLKKLHARVKLITGLLTGTDE